MKLKILLVLLCFSLILFCACESETTEPKISYQNHLLKGDDVGIGFSSWKDISIPVDAKSPTTIDYKQKLSFKGKTFWFNILPSSTSIYEILDNNIVVEKHNEQVNVLDFIFDPTERGFYNWYPELSSPRNNWGGIMKRIPNEMKNFKDKFHYLEIWLKIEEAPNDVILYIEFGRFSEDIILNGILDTEDKNNNDFIDNGEDIGLDGWTDEQERFELVIIDTTHPSYQDPSNDNFYYMGEYNSDSYNKINGIENNAKLTDYGTIPNTEDLNFNYYLDTQNDYYQFALTLNKNNTASIKYFSQSGQNGWFKIKIPIDEPDKIIGNPNLKNVEMLRFWTTNANNKVHLRIAAIYLI
ncbi:MAG: hypothetical protein JXA68_11840 [Ignavibacteriales bacterium]|nr:hypothetical protein [Ignavibacteriales bacterium]